MAVNVNGNIHLTASIADVRTAVAGSALETGRRDAAVDTAWQILTGTAAGLADKVWSDTRIVTTGATDSLDLAGTLTNGFGEVVTFAKLRAILIVAAAANTTTLQIARPAANGILLFAAVSDALATLSAGGFFCWADPAAGFAVTAATADLLSIINSAGASATYTVILVGTSV